MVKFATIFALLYGDHFELHKRLLDGFIKHAQGLPVTLWLNTVGKQTLDYANEHFFDVIESNENVPKYTLMRKLFHELPIKSEWVIWFDDDSHIVKPDWYDKTVDKIHTLEADGKNVCYLGQPWFVHWLKGQQAFNEQGSWHKGLPPEMIKNKPGITFAQGAYWWLRRDIMKMIDWPDPRLSHNGGDTLLGEAIRQQGLPFHKFHYGVAINKAKRRGRSDTPAGSKENVRR